MIGPGEPTGGRPAVTNQALAATPYGRQRLLCYASKECVQEFLSIAEARFQEAADNPPEFFARAAAVATYLQATSQALAKMPGREFFRDPAEELVSDLLHGMTCLLKQRAAPRANASDCS